MAVKEDAGQVHRVQFERLTDLADLVLRERLAAGALLWGDAGVGKSHLLGRLGNWSGPDEKKAVCVFLANLQARPEQMPRSLLRCVVSILTRGKTAGYASTPLYRIVRAAVKHALQDDGRQHLWGTAETTYWGLIDDQCAAEPARAALVDRPALAVLFEFFRSVHLAKKGYGDESVAALAVRWLSGDALDPEEAKAMGLPPTAHTEETVAIVDDEQIKRVLIALADLAAYWNRAVILCFDQVDNLERDQFAALSRFLHALLDGASNLLVVTAGASRDALPLGERGRVHAGGPRPPRPVRNRTAADRSRRSPANRRGPTAGLPGTVPLGRTGRGCHPDGPAVPPRRGLGSEPSRGQDRHPAARRDQLGGGRVASAARPAAAARRPDLAGTLGRNGAPRSPAAAVPGSRQWTHRRQGESQAARARPAPPARDTLPTARRGEPCGTDLHTVKALSGQARVSRFLGVDRQVQAKSGPRPGVRPDRAPVRGSGRRGSADGLAVLW